MKKKPRDIKESPIIGALRKKDLLIHPKFSCCNLNPFGL